VDIQVSGLLLNLDALLIQIIHRLLSYDNLVGNTTSAAKVKLPGVLEIISSLAMQWGILSSPGATHAPHFGPSGVHTVIHVHEGGKLFFLSEAKEGKPLLFKQNTSETWYTDILKNADTEEVLLLPGDCL
jgi:hypothetical protein